MSRVQGVSVLALKGEMIPGGLGVGVQDSRVVVVVGLEGRGMLPSALKRGSVRVGVGAGVTVNRSITRKLPNIGCKL